jgi:hypothetical protein
MQLGLDVQWIELGLLLVEKKTIKEEELTTIRKENNLYKIKTSKPH